MPRPKIRVIAINAHGGGYVNILCSIWCRRMEIIEVPADGGAWNGTFTAQGLNYKRSDDGYTAVHGMDVGAVLTLGDEVARGKGAGGVIGLPAQSNHYGQTRAADIPLQIESATATPTNVQVTEWS